MKMINGKLIIRLRLSEQRSVSDLDRDKWVGDMGTLPGPAFTKVLTLPVSGRVCAKLWRETGTEQKTHQYSEIFLDFLC